MPERLREEFHGHEARTIRQMNWLGIQNGHLLKLIAESGEFDVFVTMDKNLPTQQKIKDLPFAIVVLRAKSNRFEDTQPLIPELLRRLPEAQSGKALFITLLA